MKKIIGKYFTVLLALMIISGFARAQNKENSGKLFIIGGGERPLSLMKSLTDEAQISADDLIVILPFSSSIPIEASAYASEQFVALGYRNVQPIYLNKDSLIPKQAKDSIRRAAIIYITGGDQNQFMKTAERNGITEDIQYAYLNGSLIAGTSAGAAVMSKKMITGNQHLLEEYSPDVQIIHENNIEISKGLGLLQNAIIDQHFIKRMRLNRLISVAIENPDESCIGIDESTAIIVAGNTIKVCGESQVIVLKNKGKTTKSAKGLLGANDLKISIYLPGESFTIE